MTRSIATAIAIHGIAAKEQQQSTDEQEREQDVKPGALGREPPSDGGPAQQDDRDADMARAGQDCYQRAETIASRHGSLFDLRDPPPD